MSSAATCPQCSKAFSPFEPDPIMFEVRGRHFADHVFCSEACRDAWARSEYLRLRGGLRRIVARSNGVAGALAKEILRGAKPYDL